MTDIIDLTISGVPDDEAVKTEILANSEATIKNYWDRQIRAEHTEIETEISAKVDEFRSANKIGIAKPNPIEPVNEIIP